MEARNQKVQNDKESSTNHQREIKRFRVKIPIVPLKNVWLESLPYYSFFIYELIFFISVYKFENPLIFILMWWGVFPFIELFCPDDIYNYSKEDNKKLKDYNLIFLVPITLPIVFDFFLHLYFMSLLVSTEKTFLFKFFLIFGYAETQLYLSELMHIIAHYNNKFLKIIAFLSIGKNFYAHFPYEHNQGHHIHTATEKDPFFAKKGTRIYSFILDSLIKEYYSFLEISDENSKLKNLIISESYKLHALYLFNLILHLIIYGKLILPYLLILFLSVSIYNSIVNYLSHYGLERRKLANGEYEPQTHLHSWNFHGGFTNYMGFKSSRHSDHHMNPAKPYQCLYLNEESPIMPSNKAFSVYQILTDPDGFVSTWNPVVDLYMNGVNQDDKPKSQKEIEEEKAMEKLQFLSYQKKTRRDFFVYLAIYFAYFGIENTKINLFYYLF